jgi:LysM repeat protein
MLTGETMKKLILILLIVPFFAGAFEWPTPGAAEEVPVPSFINLDEADVSSAPENHEVVSGDTLWDISATYLRSPWYWPKVWSMNPQIANPHLIYPGDVISFRYTGEMMMPGREGELGGATGSEFEDYGELDELARTGRTLDTTPESYKDFVKLGGKYRIDKFRQIEDTVFDTQYRGFVGMEKTEDLGVIVGSFEAKELLATDDNVYVKLGKVTFQVGEYVEFINVKEMIKHPHTREKVGNIVDVVGRGKVLDVNAERIATVKIVKAFDSVDRGYHVREYVKTEPNIEIMDSFSNIKAVVLTGYDPTHFYGSSYIVYLDKGKKDGVDRGMMLSIYRRGDGLDELARGVEESQLPWEMIGEVVIVHSDEETSSAVITKSLTGLIAGDTAVAGVIE